MNSMNNTKMDTGVQARLRIIESEAKNMFIDPLIEHQWKAEIINERKNDQYLIISATRGEHNHCIALLFSSSTDNRIYKLLEKTVEHIFYRGNSYDVESFAHGINIPVSKAIDFYILLSQWNKESCVGKFAPVIESGQIITPQPITKLKLKLESENPIEAVWLRIRQLQSVTY